MADIFSPMPKSYFTIDGKPLHGKVEYRDPVTNNLLNTYTFDKINGWTPSRNPVYTDVYGMIQPTFTKNELTLVCSFTYVGSYDDPSVDTRPESWKHEYDFYVGFDNEQIEDENVFVGLSGLKNAPVEKGTVSVIGYYNEFDCQMRHYVWDPNATDDADDGYVVASNHTNDGKWILVWNQESLPNEIYGVTTANYSNLKNFLSYPNTVGSKNIPTCRQIEFTGFKLPNSYNNKLTTTKNVKCSRECFFGTSTFTVNSVEVIGNGNNAVGNFQISSTSNNQTVLLSWYTSTQYFFWSNANKLVYDYIDNLTQNKITSDTTLNNCTLEFTRDWSTQLTAKLTLDNVHLIMNPVYYLGEDNTNKIYLKNMDVDTRNFRKLKVSHCNNCKIDVYNEFDYDIQTDSNNCIYAHKEGGVVNIVSDPFGYVDVDWFCQIDKGTMQANPIMHGTATIDILRFASNAHNIDISDCHTLDLTGFEGTSFNLNLVETNHGNPNITLKNAKGMKLSLTNAVSNSANVRFENCDFILRRFNPIAAERTNLTFVDSKVEIHDLHYSRLCNNLTLINSSLTETRSYDDIEEGDPKILTPLELTGNLYGDHSNIRIIEQFDIKGECELHHCNVYKQDVSEWTQAQFLLHKYACVDNCYLSKMYFLYTGDGSTHNVRYTNNSLSKSTVGWGYSENADKTYGVVTGNTFESGSSIVIWPDGTPSHYCVEGNTGYKKTTNPNKIFTGTTPCGEIEMNRDYNTLKYYESVNGQWLQNHSWSAQYPGGAFYTATSTGRGEEIFTWLHQNTFFIPSKDDSKSYDQMIETINSRGFVKITEVVNTAWTTSVKSRSSNSTFAVMVNIVVQKK